MDNCDWRQRTINVFAGFPFSEETLEHLVVFLDAKEVFLKNETIDNSVSMKDAYMDIYMDIKHAYVVKQITRLNFLNLKELLQEGL